MKPFLFGIDNTVSLNSIILKDYADKNNLSISEVVTYDEPYKTYERDTARKLNQIFPMLAEYKNAENRYEIPEVIAEVLQLFLSQKSGVGSYISKLKNADIKKITYEETTAQLEMIIDRLRIKFGENEQLEYVEKEWVEYIDYLRQIREIKEYLHTFFEEQFELYIAYIIGIDSFQDITSIIEKPERNYANLSRDYRDEPDPDNPYFYEEDLGRQERIELFKTLKRYISDCFEKWKEFCIQYYQMTDEDYLEIDRNTLKQKEIIKQIEDVEQHILVIKLYKLNKKYQKELDTLKLFPEIYDNLP